MTTYAEYEYLPYCTSYELIYQALLRIPFFRTSLTSSDNDIRVVAPKSRGPATRRNETRSPEEHVNGASTLRDALNC